MATLQYIHSSRRQKRGQRLCGLTVQCTERGEDGTGQARSKGESTVDGVPCAVL
jgi:hypothetical protein